MGTTSIAMNDRALAREFLTANENFRLIHDISDNGHIAAYVGSRWDITASRRLVEEALFAWCEEIYERLEKPDPDKPNP